MRFEQVQRFIEAQKKFWGYGHFKANKELRQLVEVLDQDRIRASTANQGVTWHFNPPAAPHFGGVHESMIKAPKRAVHAILGNTDITDGEECKN